MTVPKSCYLTLIILLLCHCAPNTNSNQTSEDDKKKLFQAIQVFNKAFEDGDVQTLESMITDSYMHTNSTSKAIDKKIWVDYLEKRSAALNSGGLVVSKYEMNELKTVFHDDMAIVTGKVIVNEKKGELTTDSEYRVTHIWVMESGVWKRAGFHDGKIH